MIGRYRVTVRAYGVFIPILRDKYGENFDWTISETGVSRSFTSEKITGIEFHMDCDLRGEGFLVIKDKQICSKRVVTELNLTDGDKELLKEVLGEHYSEPKLMTFTYET